MTTRRALVVLKAASGAAMVVFMAGFLAAFLIHSVSDWVIPLMLSAVGVGLAAGLVYFAVVGLFGNAEDARPWSDEPRTDDDTLDGYGIHVVGRLRRDQLERGLCFGFWWVCLSFMSFVLYEVAFSDAHITGTVFVDTRATLEAVGAFVVGWVATRFVFYAAEKGWIR